MSRPEVWLRGPLPDVPPLLMPAAHALGAAEDIRAAAADLTSEQLWSRPGGAPSVGFHLRHVAGSLDRLLTYARGESLTDAQMAFLHAEGEPGAPAVELVRGVDDAIAIALAQIRATHGDLLAPRAVGRKQLPSTVIGLLFHAAEHTQRHTGQIVTTARVVRGL
ncbi:MAG TPA: DinB family protein [Longimicrobium sp.]|nr:DinB family protein [Longimicrobium sp.]